VCGAVHAHPILCVALQAGDAVPHLVVKNFSAATGNGVEPGIAKTRDGVPQVQIRVLRDGQNF
jgi:hypothetical protein